MLGNEPARIDVYAKPAGAANSASRPHRSDGFRAMWARSTDSPNSPWERGGWVGLLGSAQAAEQTPGAVKPQATGGSTLWGGVASG